jgi:hypothetical protein
VSPSPTPTSNTYPSPTSLTTSPATVTDPRLTRCNRTRILSR